MKHLRRLLAVGCSPGAAVAPRLLPATAFAVLAALAAPGLRAQNQSLFVTGFVGDATVGGSAGSANGTSGFARFDSPTAIALAADGTLFVADTGNNVIRRVTNTGQTTIFAGSPMASGSANGNGAAARFNAPRALAFDAEGNLYVADTGNHLVRRVTPGGDVTTIAGLAGVAGSLDGVGPAARFSSPGGLALDADGVLYVSDTDNHTIRRVATDGTVTTFAGSAGAAGATDATGGNARFARPAGLVRASHGDLFVVDAWNHTIRRITATGVVTTFVGSARSPGATNGSGSAARFNHPVGLAIDQADNLYVADAENHALRHVTPAGAVTTHAGVAGSYGTTNGFPSGARFHAPHGVAVDADGNVFVADSLNNTIRRVPASGTVSVLAGNDPIGSLFPDGPGIAARFAQPRRVAFDAEGNLFVADTLHHTIRKVTPFGEVTTFGGDTGRPGSTDGSAAVARFRFPTGLAVDADGNVFVADTGNHTIRVIASDGTVNTFAGLANNYGSSNGTGGGARFFAPTGLALAADGTLYVADSGNHTIRALAPGGAVTTLAGLAGQSGSTNASGSAARFAFPADLALDADGNLFVTDTGNNTVRRVTPAGAVTTLAGQPGTVGSTDGTGAAARFNQPDGITIDAAGTVFVSDVGTHLVRRISSNGVVVTAAGFAHERSGTNGFPTAAEFDRPAGLAFDASGTLFVADSRNDAVRRAVALTFSAGGGRLGNVSVRSHAGAGDATLIAGFIIEGTGNKPVLVRGIGPTLAEFDVAGALADPQLAIFPLGSNTALFANDNWGGGATLANAFASVSAFPLPSASLDAAVLVALPPGGYTAHVTSTAGEGIALIEGYDTDPAGSTARFVNVSARTQVGIGDNILIAGFVIGGDEPATLIVRAVGPTLAAYDVEAPLADPQLALFNAARERITANGDWGDGLQHAFASVSAFALPFESADAALIVTLPPGEYTAHASGVSGATGIGLVEIYLMP